MTDPDRTDMDRRGLNRTVATVAASIGLLAAMAWRMGWVDALAAPFLAGVFVLLWLLAAMAAFAVPVLLIVLLVWLVHGALRFAWPRRPTA